MKCRVCKEDLGPGREAFRRKTCSGAIRVTHEKYCKTCEIINRCTYSINRTDRKRKGVLVSD